MIVPIKYCLVDKLAGLAYVNLPKCACSSIKAAILDRQGVHGDDQVPTGKWARPVRQIAHRTNLFRFTVMRFPPDRLVSCWADFCAPPYRTDAPVFFPMLGWDLEEFVEYACQAVPHWIVNPHYASQARLLRYRGRLVVDRVFHFERLAEGWQTLQDRFGLPPLAHIRQSEHQPWKELLSPRLLAMIRRAYAADYEPGGYDDDGGIRCPENS